MTTHVGPAHTKKGRCAIYNNIHNPSIESRMCGSIYISYYDHAYEFINQSQHANFMHMSCRAQVQVLLSHMHIYNMKNLPHP